MTVIWVSPDGNDSTGDGSEENPYLTIGAAKSIFISGDQIRLAPGTYTPADTVDFTGVDGSILSDKPGAAIICPANTVAAKSVIRVTNAYSFTIQGVSVVQASIPANNTIGIEISNVTYAICDSCIVRDFLVTNDDLYGIYIISSRGKLMHCRVENVTNTFGNIYGFVAPRMDVIGCTASRFYGLASATVRGIFVDAAEYWVRLTSASCIVLAEVTVVFNSPMLPNAALTDPSNYTITGSTVVTVNSVTIISPTTVRLSVTGLTIEDTCVLAVANMVSVNNLPMDPAYDTVNFDTPSAKPKVLSANAPVYYNVHVIFDMAMLNDANLTNPANYTFTGPSVVTPSSVAVVGPTEVNVTVDWLNASAAYTVEVANVRSSLGVLIDPAFDTANFTGPAWYSVDLVARYEVDYNVNDTSGNAYNATLERAELPWNDFVHNPGERFGQGMAYDSDRNVLVLFGGVSGHSGFYTAYNDIWEFDGTNWKKITPVNGSAPSVRRDVQMCYDSVNHEVVIFGGSNATLTTQYKDTYTWNGATRTWALKVPGASPGTERRAGGFVFDTVRGVGVMFGGYKDSTTTVLDETWEWDGTAGGGAGTWTQKASGAVTKPGIRYWHGMTYDAGRSRALVFGGVKPGTYYQDCWEWDGTTWVDRTPGGTKPAGRYATTICYDPTAGLTIMYGGIVSPGATNDAVYSWNGGTQTWTALAPTYRPPARWASHMIFMTNKDSIFLYGGAIHVSQIMATGDGYFWNRTNWLMPFYTSFIRGRVAYNTAAQLAVFFGGGYKNNASDSPIAVFNQTLEFDGVTWTNRSAASAPQALWYHAMAYDSVRNVVVLFGGLNVSAAAQNETWEFNCTTKVWAKITPAMTTPSARYGMAMAYDPNTGYTVMFGGTAGGVSVDHTYEWDGSDWYLRAPAPKPGARSFASMTYDPDRQRVVLFGGSLSVAPNYRNDTWEWDGTNWVDRTPGSSPGIRTHGVLVYDSANSRALLFGGADGGGSKTDTWQWKWTAGVQAWTQLTVAVVPLSRAYHVAFFDTVHNNLSVAGGVAGSNPQAHRSTVMGFTHYPVGKLYESLVFDGSGSTGANTAGTCESVLVPTNVDTAIMTANTYTICFWVRFHELGSATRDQTLVGRRIYVAPNSKGSFFIRNPTSTNVIVATTYGTVSNSVATSTTMLALQTWYHVGVTFSTTDHITRLYINGSLDTTAAAGAGNINDDTADRILIGASQYTTTAQRGSYLDGEMDQVLFYDRVLSLLEMTAFYNSGAGIYW